MKKLSYLFLIGVLTSSVLFTGCGKDDEEEDDDDTTVDECASSTFPSTNGTATVNILNYTTTSGNFTTVSASAGDVLSFAVEVTKGTNRPQDFRIYVSECENTLGTQEGDELDLRNTDKPQIKQFTYSVPSGKSTLYLNIEVDESSSTYTYKRIKLNISGSGIIDTWSNVQLGAQENSLASRMSSGTGETYKACDAFANLNYIDITYSVSNVVDSSYLSSNPARFLDPIELTKATVDCDDDGTKPTDGGTATYFKEYTGTNYSTISDSELSALTVSNANAQYVAIKVGGVYEFLNSSGKKGLIYVKSGTINDAFESIVVEVKVQR